MEKSESSEIFWRRIVGVLARERDRQNYRIFHDRWLPEATVTRLLEAEKSMRERDQDNERKGEAAKEHNKEIPPAFEEYLRLKEKEVELLKTLPPRLFPYYKKEVTEYFKRIN